MKQKYYELRKMIREQNNKDFWWQNLYKGYTTDNKIFKDFDNYTVEETFNDYNTAIIKLSKCNSSVSEQHESLLTFPIRVITEYALVLVEIDTITDSKSIVDVTYAYYDDFTIFCKYISKKFDLYELKDIYDLQKLLENNSCKIVDLSCIDEILQIQEKLTDDDYQAYTVSCKYNNSFSFDVEFWIEKDKISDITSRY